MAHKKKKKNGWLPAEDRPLFGPWHSVHNTKKDKEQSRRVQKQKTKDAAREIEE